MMISHNNVQPTPTTPQPGVAMRLRQECLALLKRILSNRCDACGKTPTIKTEVGIVGRLVFCVCAGCIAKGSFSIDPQDLLVSAELAMISHGDFPESVLIDLPTSGRVQ